MICITPCCTGPSGQCTVFAKFSRDACSGRSSEKYLFQSCCSSGVRVAVTVMVIGSAFGISVVSETLAEESCKQREERRKLSSRNEGIAGASIGERAASKRC